MGNNTNIRYVPVVLFALNIILEIKSLIGRGVNINFSTVLSLVTIAGVVLIAVAMLAAIPGLVSAGAGIVLLTSVIELLRYIVNVISVLFDGYNGYRLHYLTLIIVLVLNIIYWVILLMVGACKSNAKMFGIIAGGVAGVRLVLVIIRNKVLPGYENRITTEFVIFTLIYIVGAITIGLAIDAIRANSAGNNAVM